MTRDITRRLKILDLDLLRATLIVSTLLRDRARSRRHATSGHGDQ